MRNYLQSFYNELQYICDNLMCNTHSIGLTRFNKIAIQGTPQMAVEEEAIICLSRVYSYYFNNISANIFM